MLMKTWQNKCGRQPLFNYAFIIPVYFLDPDGMVVPTDTSFYQEIKKNVSAKEQLKYRKRKTLYHMKR
jgi:hypothetical protein